jgi:hypothetical protein
MRIRQKKQKNSQKWLLINFLYNALVLSSHPEYSERIDTDIESDSAFEKGSYKLSFCSISLMEVSDTSTCNFFSASSRFIYPCLTRAARS